MPFDGTLYEDEILRVLSAAQERIRDPKNWCQGGLYDAGPVCARGAIMVALGMSTKLSYTNSCFPGWTSQYHKVDDYLYRTARQLGHRGTVAVNTTDHLTVMAMFDRAQELRRAEINAKALVA